MIRTRALAVAAALALGLAGALALTAPAAGSPVRPASSRGHADAAASVTALAGDGAAAVRTGLDDFTFESFAADYTLTRASDGTSRMRVVETLVAVFPDTDQNRGIRRAIPDTYNGQPLRPELVSITDENGAPRNEEVEDVDDEFSVVSRADDYVHGRQTYVITYTLENVTWDFPDTGLEFYWDVNGVGWAQPFGSVTARLHLAPDLADQLTGDYACYQGSPGAKDACASIVRSSEPGGTVITAKAADIAPYAGLTMSVGFAPGTFAMFDGSYLHSPIGWLQAIAGAGSLSGLVLALRARRRALADEPGRPTIIPEYDPPRAVDALESAVLLGRKDKGIPAEVLEQAVVGSLRIIEGAPKWWGRTPLIAQLLDPSRADGDGLMLLGGLFPGGVVGEEYEFGRQDARFSRVAQAILAAAETELATRGLRRSVRMRDRALPVLVAVGGAVLAGILGFVALDRQLDQPWPLIVSALAIGIVVVTVRLVARRPVTALGAETRDHLKGLEWFISWTEEDRIRMLQSPRGAERAPIDANDPRQKLVLYEKLLPYAVVFGQEKEWSKELAVLYSQVGAVGPGWYYGGSGSFDASSFASSVGSLSAAASSSSSTSGGSSGGGSSGGGGGGGGGGGV